ncbi:unnamed protein product, partial [Rotaria sordida]
MHSHSSIDKTDDIENVFMATEISSLYNSEDNDEDVDIVLDDDDDEALLFKIRGIEYSTRCHEASKTIGQKTSQPITLINNVPWQTTDTIRLKSRELLANALSVTRIPEGSGDPVKLSARIEDVIFKEIKDTTVKYGRRIRSRIFNLRDLKNPDLRIKVLLGSITPERLAVMTAEEMISDTLKKECAKFKEIAHRESLLAVDEGIGSDLIQCER